MLITLTGNITNKLEQYLVLETYGFGYQVWMANPDLEKVNTGQEAQLWIYEHLREDAHDLYGFWEYQQRELFVKLISVSGVGPKAALAILSVGGFGNVSQAITNGDVALLQSAQGIGKRTAERIIMELKGSIDFTSSEKATAGVDDNAKEALQSLGYSPVVAAQALAKVPGDLSEEERIKQALREM